MKQEKGFAALQLVLIVVLAVLIGGIGFYIYKAQKNTINTLENSQMASTGDVQTDKKLADTTPTKEEDSWQLYESPGKEFTMRLADGWEFQRYQKSTSIYQRDNTKLALVPGKKAIVTEVDGGSDGPIGLFISYADQNIEQIYKEGDKQTGLQTQDGLDVEKYYYVETKEPEGIGLGKGSTQYTYVVYKGTKQAITITYSFMPGATDYHEVVERALKTVHFNK